jgi:hypothetical protein
MLLEFQRKLAREALIIVVAEFIKVVGSQARSRSRDHEKWMRAGARVFEIAREDAKKAGEYLLKMPEVPIADALTRRKRQGSPQPL